MHIFNTNQVHVIVSGKPTDCKQTISICFEKGAARIAFLENRKCMRWGSWTHYSLYRDQRVVCIHSLVCCRQ